MTRIDDYIHAKKIAAEQLAGESFEKIAQRSGFETCNGNVFLALFLDNVFRVSFPEFDFKNSSEQEKEVPIQEQVLILHYMMQERSLLASGSWISYREIPGASFYYSAFLKRAIDPLKKVFGQNVSGLKIAAQKLNGSTIETGDAGFEFIVLPKVPVQLIFWEGDEEFQPEANILFDKNIGDIFSPEDVAWLAGMLVYRLIALSC